MKQMLITSLMFLYVPAFAKNLTFKSKGAPLVIVSLKTLKSGKVKIGVKATANKRQQDKNKGKNRDAIIIFY